VMQQLLLAPVKSSALSAYLALDLLTKNFEILLHDSSAVLYQCAGKGTDEVKCQCRVSSTGQADRGLTSEMQRPPQQECMACWSKLSVTVRATDNL